MLSQPEPLSPRNSRVKHLRDIARSRASRESEGAVLVEGATLIAEALAAGWDVLEEFVGPGGEQVTAGVCTPLTAAALERVATTTEPQPSLLSDHCLEATTTQRAYRAKAASFTHPKQLGDHDLLAFPRQLTEF